MRRLLHRPTDRKTFCVFISQRNNLLTIYRHPQGRKQKMVEFRDFGSKRAQKRPKNGQNP